jgi:hypothetical protein
VKDGRKKRGCRYSLALILTLLLLARLAGERLHARFDAAPLAPTG